MAGDFSKKILEQVLAKRSPKFGVSEGFRKNASMYLEKQALLLHTLLFRMIQPVSAHSRAPLSANTSRKKRDRNGSDRAGKRKA